MPVPHLSPGRSRAKALRLALFAFLAPLVGAVAAPVATTPADLQWITFPDARLELRGLPWFKENAPELWRLPRHVRETGPRAVWARAVAPDGGRIRFASTTTRLVLRVQVVEARAQPCFFDVFVDGQSAGSAGVKGRESTEAVLFERQDARVKDITIYLPHNQQVRVLAVGVDAAAEMKPPAAFALARPLVCYGSSVLQGTGATHPSATYPAILARQLNVDFVNLGFGGAGKAEPDIVKLVNALDGCAYLFDLGKSYGAQPAAPYARMLDVIRAAHPDAPVFCVTPIYSTKEASDPDYLKRSVDLRTMMRAAARERAAAGDQRMIVVEGLELFGPSDKDALHDPQHPNDAGNARMAQRLAPVVRAALFGPPNPPATVRSAR